MKGCLISFVLMALTFDLFAQAQRVKVTALSFPQLQDSMQVNPKRILVNLYTDWCLYCKMQDRQIEKSDSIQRVLNRDFYYVKMNAETSAGIRFNGREYKGRSVGMSERVHELAEVLGTENGQMAYPVLVVLDPAYQVLFRSQGFLDNKKLYTILLSAAAVQ